MSTVRGAMRAGLAVLAVALTLSCGSDDGPTGTAASIQLSADTPELAVAQGANGSLTVTLTRNGGFSGPVTLALTGLPSGVVVTIAPVQLSGATASATVNLSVPAATALGTHALTITATAPGVAQATTTFNLTITPLPSYDLRVAALTVAAGASGSINVHIDRTNFTGAVVLTLQNPPAGITGVFTPASATTSEAALVVSAATAVAPGTYPILIQGTASGPGSKQAMLQLTVTPAGNNIEYQFCDASSVPDFFAYQDGTGAWQAVTGATAGSVTRFRFAVTQGRGGILTVFRSSAENVMQRAATRRPTGARTLALARARFGGARAVQFDGVGTTARQRHGRADSYETRVLHASAVELAKDGIDNCARTVARKTITGTVAGVTGTARGIVSMGDWTVLFVGGVSTNPITFFDVPPGEVDFAGTRMPRPGEGPDRVIVRRRLDQPDGSALPFVIDFDGPLASPAATAMANISGAGSDRMEVYVELVTRSTRSLIWFDLAPSVVANRPWGGLTPASMERDDLHGLVVFAGPAQSDDYRVTFKYVGPVENHNVALGPWFDLPAVTQVDSGAYPRLRFQGTLPPEYHRAITIDLASDDESGNVFSLTSTDAYLSAAGAARAYDFTVPDVAAIPGFPLASGLTTGANTLLVFAAGYAGPIIFDVVPSLGSEYKEALRQGAVTVR